MIFINGNNNRVIVNNSFNRGGGSRKEDDGLGAFLLFAVVSAIIIFFQNTNLVFSIVELGSLGLLLALSMKSIYEVSIEDNESAMHNLIPALPIVTFFVLSIYFKNNIPHELIVIFKDMNFGEFLFNSKLTSYGRNLSFDIFCATLILILTQLFNAYFVFRKVVSDYLFKDSMGLILFTVLNLGSALLAMYMFKFGLFR